MTTYAQRQVKHETHKKMLKWDFSGDYSDKANETYLLVSIGFGNEIEVSLAANKYIHEMDGILRLIDTHESFKYVAMKEERAGFIGKPSYKRSIQYLWFHVLDKETREEFYELVGEENWTEITKLFGGNNHE